MASAKTDLRISAVAVPRTATADMRSRHRSAQASWFVIAMAVMAGLLLASAYSQTPSWWTAWAALGLALASTLLAQPKLRTPLALAIGLIGGVTSIDYYATISQNAGVAAVLAGGRALLWMSMLTLSVRIIERIDARVAVFALPIVLAAADTIINRVSEHGAAGSLAYSQMDLLPIVQLASAGGTSAIIFVVRLGGSAIGLLLAHALGRSDLHAVRDATIIAGLVVLGALVFGYARLQSADNVRTPVSTPNTSAMH